MEAEARDGRVDEALDILIGRYGRCRDWQRQKLLDYLSRHDGPPHRTLRLVLFERWLQTSDLADEERSRLHSAYAICLRYARRFADTVVAADDVAAAEARAASLRPIECAKIEAAAIYALSRLGDHNAAQFRFEQAFGNWPKSPELFDVGMYLLLTRQPERLVELAERRPTDRMSRNTFVHLMAALERLERFDELEARLTEATKVPAPRQEAWLFQANLALAAGEANTYAEYVDRFFRRWSLRLPERGLGSQVALPEVEPSAAPTLTVVMTAFNSSAHLDPSIASLLTQTFTDFELLVVDDASTDDGATVRAIEAWEQRDPRVRLIRRRTNGGTYRAKNTALSCARGRFITCHDSDDLAFPWRFAQEVRILKRRPGLMAVQSAWVRITEAGRFVAMRWGAFVHENPASLMFRREVLDAIGPFDGARAGADTEFRERLRVFYGAAAYAYTETPLTLGSYRSDSLTTAGAAALDEDLVSPERIEYWAAWSRWHADCAHRGAIACELPLRSQRLPPFQGVADE